MSRVFVEVDDSPWGAFALFIVTSPWWLPLFSPSFFGVAYVMSLGIHTLFTIILSILVLVLNGYVILGIFRILPNIVCGILGAIYSGFIMWAILVGFFEVQDLVWTWAGVLVAAFLGGGVFFSISDDV